MFKVRMLLKLINVCIDQQQENKLEFKIDEPDQ